MANNVDPNQTSPDMGQHCLHNPLCPNTSVLIIYGNFQKKFCAAIYLTNWHIQIVQAHIRLS